jgi:hypothetical protein
VHAGRGEESIVHMIRLYAGHALLQLEQLARIRRHRRRPSANKALTPASGAGVGELSIAATVTNIQRAPVLKDDPEITASDVIEIAQILDQNRIDVCMDGGGVSMPCSGSKQESIATWT